MTNASETEKEIARLTDRLMNLHREAEEVAEGIKDLYLEAKSKGIDTAALRALIAFKRKDPDKLRERAEIMRVMAPHVGVDFASTPLGAVMAA